MRNGIPTASSMRRYTSSMPASPGVHGYGRPSLITSAPASRAKRARSMASATLGAAVSAITVIRPRHGGDGFGQQRPALVQREREQLADQVAGDDRARALAGQEVENLAEHPERHPAAVVEGRHRGHDDAAQPLLRLARAQHGAVTPCRRMRWSTRSLSW